MEVGTKVLHDAEQYVRHYINEHFPDEFVYHNFDHTRQVVEASLEISLGFDLSEKKRELLLLAAWFHDTGYAHGAKNHEGKSCEIAKDFLSKYNYTENELQTIFNCILATKVDAQTQNLLEEIICDADLSHLGKKSYWNLSGRLRQELTTTQNMILSEQEWVTMELNFLKSQQYNTYVAHELYIKRKQKHLRQLTKRLLRLNPEMELLPEEKALLEKKGKKKKKKKKLSVAGAPHDTELKQLNLGRGVETMFRTTYRTHVNLSSIADNKANIMLSINAIIISISVSTLIPRFETNTKLIIPTIVLLVVCLSAMVFATLSTRPKVTEGVFSRDDIEHKRSNLLFFGNFYKMKLDDFHWGMMEMIKDSDFLYSSMTRDIYYLGVVLAKKYKYLRICYSVFMYGLIIAVIAFAIAYIPAK